MRSRTATMLSCALSLMLVSALGMGCGDDDDGTPPSDGGAGSGAAEVAARAQAARAPAQRTPVAMPRSMTRMPDLVRAQNLSILRCRPFAPPTRRSASSTASSSKTRQSASTPASRTARFPRRLAASRAGTAASLRCLPAPTRMAATTRSPPIFAVEPKSAPRAAPPIAWTPCAIPSSTRCSAAQGPRKTASTRTELRSRPATRWTRATAVSEPCACLAPVGPAPIACEARHGSRKSRPTHKSQLRKSPLLRGTF